MNIDELNNEINKFVENEIEYIQNCINNIHEVESEIFLKEYIFYGKDYQNNKSYNQVRGEHGIYIIYMNEDLLLNYKLVYNFNENGTGGKFKEYREYNLKKGDCIYLGTCISKSLFSRLHQHFENSNCYGSLQLGNEFRKILKDKIKIFAFPIKSSCNEILLKNIEKRLHEILNPTNGSKRV